MTERGPRSDAVEFLDVDELHLVETAAPSVVPEHQRAMDQVWDAAVQANPGALFDGPVVVCTGLERRAGRLVISWARVTYRHFALRWVPGAVALPSIFVVVVQPTRTGGVLVGRMSASTAAPGRLQCPGGSVEPPDGDLTLDEAALRRHAVRELAEETGVGAVSGDLRLWCVTRGEHGNIGIFFCAPSLPEAEICDRFAGVVCAAGGRGCVPELQEIVFVHSADELAYLDWPQVDYLEPLLRRHAQGPRRSQ